MVYNLLSMLGTHDRAEMTSTLLAMSSSPDSCKAMRQSGTSSRFFFSYYPQLWKNVFILIRIYSRYYYESSRYAELECVITSFSFSTKISESFEWQFHGGMKHGHYKSSFMGINEKRNASNNSLVFSFLECICRTR